MGRVALPYSAHIDCHPARADASGQALTRPGTGLTLELLDRELMGNERQTRTGKDQGSKAWSSDLFLMFHLTAFTRS
jgi:hypothetical protein